MMKASEKRERKTTVSAITIQEAQAQLADLIHRLKPGGEVVIPWRGLCRQAQRPAASLVHWAP
jgi:antitoxin (DNA-binding transcriptional repressor) of toxin-antitoxin stability system